MRDRSSPGQTLCWMDSCSPEQVWDSRQEKAFGDPIPLQTPAVVLLIELRHGDQVEGAESLLSEAVSLFVPVSGFT